MILDEFIPPSSPIECSCPFTINEMLDRTIRINLFIDYQVFIKLALTFGGMCSWRRVAVARVFALVVRYRVMRLLLYSRVGKNRDTRRGPPAGAGAGRTADHLAIFFSQKVLAVRSGNCIYRPVTSSFFLGYSYCLVQQFYIEVDLSI